MQKNLGHKIYLLWSNEKYWEGKFDIVCNIMFICPSLNLGIYVIGSMLHARLKLILRWCVQNLSTFNDDTNYKPVSMISNLTETTMCLIEETGDSTHERTGRGSWGLPPSPLPPPGRQLRFFGQQEKFWQNRFCKSFHVSFTLSFFFMKAIFFYLKLK